MEIEKPDEVLTALQAERERRLQAKVDAGEIVRVSLWVAGEDIADAESKIEQAKIRKTAELRAAGDTREIFWEITAVSTGVPRDPDSEKRKPSTEPPPLLMPDPAEPLTEPQPEPPAPPQYVRTQIRQPSESNPCGTIAEGKFIIDRGTVVVNDVRGRFLGRALLRANDDPAAVARRVLREQYNASYEPLKYPRTSIA